MAKVRYLVILLVILLIILLALIYLYLLITRLPTKERVEFKGMTPILSIYGFGARPQDMLDKPHGVAVDARGNIHTTDTNHGRVVVFDRNGRFLYTYGKLAVGREAKPGEFYHPLGIAIDQETNRAYITDKTRSIVSIYDTSGKFIKEFPLKRPITPLIANNRLYVATEGPIYLFDKEGRKLDKWGQRGRAVGEFDFPNGLAADEEGNIYVSDFNNTRLVKLNKKGEVIWIKGRPPLNLYDPDRPFGLPTGVALDEKGHIYLNDAFHFTIKVFDQKGNFLTELGSGHSGDAEGEFYFHTGIAYMGNGLFVVADKYNDRLQILKISLEEAIAKKKPSLLGKVWSLLKAWCPYLFLLILIIVLGFVGLAERKKRSKDLTDTRVTLE